MSMIFGQDRFVEAQVLDLVSRERSRALSRREWKHRLAGYGYSIRETDFGEENLRSIEKQVLLQTIDSKWREHLLTLEHLRSVVGFRGYAQRDPLNEYKSEAFQLFEGLLDGLRADVTKTLGNLPTRAEMEEQQQRMIEQLRAQQAVMAGAADAAGEGADAAPEGPSEAPAPLVAGFDENDPETWGKPGRNDPCPCGSGKKFKHCHGRLA